MGAVAVPLSARLREYELTRVLRRRRARRGRLDRVAQRLLLRRREAPAGRSRRSRLPRRRRLGRAPRRGRRGPRPGRRSRSATRPPRSSTPPGPRASRRAPRHPRQRSTASARSLAERLELTADDVTSPGRAGRRTRSASAACSRRSRPGAPPCSSTRASRSSRSCAAVRRARGERAARVAGAVRAPARARPGERRGPAHRLRRRRRLPAARARAARRRGADDPQRVRDDRDRGGDRVPRLDDPPAAAARDGRAAPCRATSSASCGAAGGDRRAPGARPVRDARLLQPAGDDRGGVRRRLVPHRRPGDDRRGRATCESPGASKEVVHVGGLQRLSGGGRGLPAHPPRRGPGRRRRRAARADGRGRWPRSWCRAAAPSSSPAPCSASRARGSRATSCRTRSGSLDELPLLPSGKPDRAALRRRWIGVRTRTATSFEGVPVPVAALEGVPLFAGLERAELVDRRRLDALPRLRGRRALCREGEPGGSMFVIVDGLANELRWPPTTRRPAPRSVFAEGRLVGKLRQRRRGRRHPLITGEPRPATVRAAVPTAALELARRDFGELIAGFPALVANLSRLLSEPARGRHPAPGPAGRPRRGGGARRRRPGSRRRFPRSSPPRARRARGRRGGRTVEPSLDAAFGAARRRCSPITARSSSARPLSGETLPLLLEQVDRAVVLGGERDPALPTGAAPVEVIRPEARRWPARLAPGRGRLARPPPGAHEARARARGRRREGLRPRRRAPGARGGRLHGRLRRRQQHRRDRRRLRGARHGRGRDRARRCARRSRPRPSPRSSSSRSAASRRARHDGARSCARPRASARSPTPRSRSSRWPST